MPKIKSRSDSTEDVKQARLAAAHSFRKGDRVRHQVTQKLGVFQELNLGFALPEVWVQFDSETEIQFPISCNPLELELVAKDSGDTSSAIATAVVEELTEAEERDRHRLELRVERAFYEAGKALTQLRDRRLYRSTHRNFESYCHERFGMKRIYAHYLIDAAVVVDNLSSGCSQIVNILPTNESQCRPLAKLEPESQRTCWQQAVEQAGGKVPSARIVKGIVEQLKEKPLRYATDFGQVGDAFTLMRLEGCERKYNGCPCVATKLKDFTIEVEVFDETIAVKPENLRPIDDPDACRQLPEILKRIKRLRNVGLLDRGAEVILQHLGRQTYLTDLEVELLTFLEQRYGVGD
ncbi:MAG: hypothetical protein N4J56_004092 [Chroococcidiopsis sp. SAG 2025]|uniref:hypothetical protein n=1 Tax=Chroococcidiopsis sp. SAG 2025 TaxID=171389 RepID=UPI0029372D98|nr:hypothetical protein [Chroococcidiopsis sp. SAG 2025]MDV2994438.1 hypothetical protein [Chroococcidiopsis sp. SAG 2025]